MDNDIDYKTLVSQESKRELINVNNNKHSPTINNNNINIIEMSKKDKHNYSKTNSNFEKIFNSNLFSKSKLNNNLSETKLTNTNNFQKLLINKNVEDKNMLKDALNNANKETIYNNNVKSKKSIQTKNKTNNDNSKSSITEDSLESIKLKSKNKSIMFSNKLNIINTNKPNISPILFNKTKECKNISENGCVNNDVTIRNKKTSSSEINLNKSKYTKNEINKINIYNYNNLYNNKEAAKNSKLESNINLFNNKNFKKSHTNNLNKSSIYNEPIKKSQSNEFGNFEFELEKKKKQRIDMLWNRFRYLTKGLISFRKLSKSIRLYGNSEEIFDANNPEKFEQKLKIIQKKNKDSLDDTYSSNNSNNKINNNIYNNYSNNNLFETNVYNSNRYYNINKSIKHNKKRNKIKHKRSKHCNNLIYNIKQPINPDSMFLFYWNMYLSLLMIYTAIFLPYYLAFIDEKIFAFEFMESLVDFSFLFDVILNFNVSFYKTDKSKESKLVRNRRDIAKNYIKTWFFIDLLSSIPFSLIINSTVRLTSTLIKFTKLPKLYRLNKMFRLVKMSRYIKKIKFVKKLFNVLGYGLTKLFAFLLTTLIFSHIFACLWYLLPRIFSENNNWTVEFNLQNQNNIRLYLYSLYYSFTTLFTIGFGDIYSVNEVEKILSILWMLFGIGFYSFTIGTLSSVLADMDSRENKLKYKLSILNDFAKESNLNSVLKGKIKKVLIHNSTKHAFSWTDKQNMFNDLPITLKVEIAKAMKNNYLKDISFFSNKDDNFVALVVPFLLPWNVHEKETIYKINDHPNQSKIILYN